LVHSIATSSTIDQNHYIHGISLYYSDNSTVKNNMVRVGLDSQGKNVPGVQIVYAIVVIGNGTDVTNNSLFVDGQGNNTAAALYISSETLPATVNNNILVNTRTVKQANTSYYGDSYAIVSGLNLIANY